MDHPGVTVGLAAVPKDGEEGDRSGTSGWGPKAYLYCTPRTVVPALLTASPVCWALGGQITVQEPELTCTGMLTVGGSVPVSSIILPGVSPVFRLRTPRHREVSSPAPDHTARELRLTLR